MECVANCKSHFLTRHIVVDFRPVFVELQKSTPFLLNHVHDPPSDCRLVTPITPSIFFLKVMAQFTKAHVTRVLALRLSSTKEDVWIHWSNCFAGVGFSFLSELVLRGAPRYQLSLTYT
jgi:hypothetical protein